jgi:hypothetical protein
MRKSQAAVVSVLGLVVVLMIGVAAWVRLFAEPLPELSGERRSRTYDHSGFDRVDVSGQWDITLERGDAWRVAVEVPAELADDVAVELAGDELSLSLERGWWPGGFGGGNELRATVTMPALEALDLSGATNLRFSGFDGAELSVDMSGAGDVRGNASRFDRLTLDMSGAGNADFGDVTVTDADVDVSGAGNVRLRMAGGRLTGDMSGAGNLEYSGPVREESVNRSGWVNVRRRD